MGERCEIFLVAVMQNCLNAGQNALKQVEILNLLARSFLHGPNSLELLPQAFNLAQKISRRPHCLT